MFYLYKVIVPVKGPTAWSCELAAWRWLSYAVAAWSYWCYGFNAWKYIGVTLLLLGGTTLKGMGIQSFIDKTLFYT